MPDINDFQLLAQSIQEMDGYIADLEKAVSANNNSSVKKLKAAIISLQSRIKNSILKLKQ